MLPLHTMTVLLSTTYFGPVWWYSLLHRADTVYIEACESYQKQTLRSRCTIGSADGPLTLTVPVSYGAAEGGVGQRSREVGDMLVSDHGQWRHLHWQALVSAYRDTPFFCYYADDLHPFFERRDWSTLWQLNEAAMQTLCRLMGLQPNIAYTTAYTPPDSLPDGVTDLRTRRGTQDTAWPPFWSPRPYWQPFLCRRGFMPGLSVLDLLFCMGPEARLYL